MARMTDPAKRDTWRRRLTAFDRGDSSVAEFCRRAGVSVASFYQWRRRLRLSAAAPCVPKRGRGLAGGQDVRSAFPRRTAPAVSFVPVEITGRSNIEVHLPNGARVIVPCHDRKAIRTVIAAVANDRREVGPC